MKKKRFNVYEFNSGNTLEKNSIWHVYMIRCADDTIYTGVTNDLQNRLNMHNKGRGAKYTRSWSRRPVRLEFVYSMNGKRAAYKVEYEMKQLTREEKERIIKEYGQQRI